VLGWNDAPHGWIHLFVVSPCPHWRSMGRFLIDGSVGRF